MAGGGSKVDSKRSDKRLRVKKQTKKEKNAAKDPNKPKRAPSAFLIFMGEFRKQFKENNPSNKSVAVVGRAGGDEWKLMTPEEKAPFQAEADKRKEEYGRKMEAYNKKLAGDDDESDKSNSEISNEDGEKGSGEEDNN